MDKKVRFIIDALNVRYPDALCALHYEKDYELMIAVRLSAQCTDARVNLVTPALFAAYPTLEALANAQISDIEGYIHSCGFYRQKAKDIVLACQMLLREYDGKVPGTMEQLLKLPGVGRKTANLVLGDIFNKPAVVVDTHCIRLSNKIGLTKNTDPVKIEFDLKKLIPDDRQLRLCHQLVNHGRVRCVARRPDCENCEIKEFCKSYKNK